MTSILLVCLVVALVVSLMQLRRPKSGWGGFQSLLLVACVGLAVYEVVLHPRSASPEESVALFEEAAAHRMGKMVKASAPARGTVLVLRWDASSSPGVIGRAQDRGLRDGLGETRLEIVVKGPAGDGEEEALDALLTEETPVSDESVRGWIEAIPDLVAVVSFLDIPPLRDARFLENLPAVFLKASSSPEELQSLATKGLLDGVVVEKPGVNPAGIGPNSLDLDAAFDLGYHLLP